MNTTPTAREERIHARLLVQRSPLQLCAGDLLVRSETVLRPTGATRVERLHLVKKVERRKGRLVVSLDNGQTLSPHPDDDPVDIWRPRQCFRGMGIPLAKRAA